VRREGDAVSSAVAVLDQHVVLVQVEDDDERPGTVRRRERMGLPAPGGQSQRRVLQLRLGWRQGDGELAQHLGVGVQGVERGPPRLVGERRPLR